jgi:ABC-2 type transport system permease protein
MFRLNTKQLSFKVVGVHGVLPYLFIIAILFYQGRLTANPTGRSVSSLSNPYFDSTTGQQYALQFYNALGYQLLYLVILTVIAGAGSIASDNRNNALLIYLSKPITKNDYVLGKWVGLFLTLFVVAFGPALLLYIYCLISFYSDGFLRNEPRLLWHIVESTAITCAVFTSTMLGLSAWSKSPRITGAILAGLYFSLQIVTFAFWSLFSRGDYTKNVVMLHSSIGGAISGLTQGIYGVTIHTMRGNFRRGFHPSNITPPSSAIMWMIVIGLIVVGISAARLKVRAVEVIT